MPSAVVTVTSTVPVPAGAMAEMVPTELTVYEVAGFAPKDTPVTLANPVPLIITWVPPPAGPPGGVAVVEIEETVGVVT